MLQALSCYASTSESECVWVCFRGGEVLTQILNCEQLTSNILITSNRAARTSSLLRRNDLFVLGKESFSLHFAMFSLFIFHLLIFFPPHLPRILFFPNGFIPCAHTSCLHSTLYLCLCKYFSHCTRHKSHFTLHHSISVLFLTQTASFFVPRPYLQKINQWKKKRYLSLKIDMKKIWQFHDKNVLQMGYYYYYYFNFLDRM